MFKKISVFILLISLSLISEGGAQMVVTAATKTTLDKYQDTLKTLSDSSFSTLLDENKLKYNAQFVKKLVIALKSPPSFDNNFDSLKNVSFLKSPDNSFRIITWFLPLANGAFKFYGSIQMRTTHNTLKLLPLTDDTPNFTNTNLITTGKKWYGARYYEIAPVVTAGKPTYFVLLGWKGNDEKTSKKLIDVLSFEKGEPIFGKNIFETTKKGSTVNRVIFEYNRQNAMTLIYDKIGKTIIFDHLAPYDPEMVGNFEYYASDLSFDAYVINYTKFRLTEDVDLKNEASATDELYVPPVKASTVKTSRQ